MNTFTASSGTVTVTESVIGSFKTLEVETVDNSVKLAGIHVDALREFFRAEEDKRLGRWRWPDNPSIVVYRKAVGDGIHWSFDERTGISQMNTRAGCQNFEDAHALAARAYFDAHPEPRPWSDAKAGEVWALTVDDVEKCVRVLESSGGPRFFPLTDDAGIVYGLRSEAITAGRRIWPEVAS